MSRNHLTGKTGDQINTLVGRCRVQSSEAAALDRFFACFGAEAAAGIAPELQIAPRAAFTEPLTDEGKFMQIATAQSAEDLSGMTNY